MAGLKFAAVFPLVVEVASKSEMSALVIASMVTMASYETPLTVTTSS